MKSEGGPGRATGISVSFKPKQRANNKFTMLQRQSSLDVINNRGNCPTTYSQKDAIVFKFKLSSVCALASYQSGCSSGSVSRFYCN